MRPIDLLFIETFHGILEHKEIAKIINKNVSQIRYAISKHNIKPNGRREYAIYKGDEFLFSGIRHEIMDRFDISEAHFWFCSTPSNLKRLDEGKNVYVIVNLGKVPIDVEKILKNKNMLEKAFGKIENYWSDAS